jgi:GNAT superfamily N-acetyltransferase
MFFLEIKPLPPEKWHKYRELRVNALKQSPHEFIRTLEEEAHIPKEVWVERLKKAERMEDFWMFFGAEVGKDPVAMISASLGNGEKICHIATISGPYVLPEYRDNGIAIKLIKTIVQEISKKPDVRKARVFIAMDQGELVSAYESQGFKMMGELVGEIKTEKGYMNEYILEKNIILEGNILTV